MNRLPNYWIVENDFSQKYKDSVLKYLCQEYNRELQGLGEYYGNGDGYWRCYSSIESFKNNPTLLTLDQFIELSKPIDEFVLPDKWYVKINNPQEGLILTNWAGFDWYKSSPNNVIFITSDKCWAYTHVQNYTEITFEQFQKYVLKSKDMEKKIVGYKLKEDCKKYMNAVSVIGGNEYTITNQMTFKGYPTILKRLEEAGVLELWFDPAYEEEFPNITINGYKGEFFDGYVKFGCAEISREVFIDLFTCREYPNTNKDIESVTIGKGTFTKEQIKEIAEYYNAKISK